jgi:uncharacterized SAM-binding protein YcdF (DUF218 family)
MLSLITQIVVFLLMTFKFIELLIYLVTVCLLLRSDIDVYMIGVALILWYITMVKLGGGGSRGKLTCYIIIIFLEIFLYGQVIVRESVGHGGPHHHLRHDVHTDTASQ